MNVEFGDSLSARLRGCAGPAPVGVVAGALNAVAGARDDAPHALESLHERMTALSVATPADLPRRALAGQRSVVHSLRHPRRRVLVAMSGFVVVALNVPALYLVPVYADAVGHLPGVSAFLQWTGLGASDVSTIDAGTEHDGVRVHVSAGYADENHTMLILDYRALSSTGGFVNFGTMTLTDQFGHAYAPRQSGFGEKGKPGAKSDTVPGYASFEPITGAAAGVGARLTLHVAGLHAMPAVPGPGGVDIPGSWDVTFTLQRHPAVHLQWAAATLPGATYSFSSVTVTGSTHVEIAWEASGPAVETANANSFAMHRTGQPTPGGVATAPAPPQTDPMSPLRPLIPELTDPHGNVVTGTVELAGPVLTMVGDRISGVASYSLKPGVYHFVVDATSEAGFSRELVIG
jgi:hypothetical protein